MPGGARPDAGGAEGLTDLTTRQSSLLPGWTVGHLLTHLARNAEASVRRVQAAARGEVVDQYDGGARGRAAEIDFGAGRASADLVADVATWSQRLVKGPARSPTRPRHGGQRPKAA